MIRGTRIIAVNGTSGHDASGPGRRSVGVMPLGGKAWARRASAMAKASGIFTLAVFALTALAACEFFDATVAKTVDGRTVYLGPWRMIGERESLIYFLAGKRPDIDFVEMRIRDNNVLQERIHLKSGANARPSTVFVEYLPASTHYTPSTIQGLGRKSDALERARKAFPGTKTTNAEQRENSVGEYLYVAADTSGGEKCLFARQGFDLRKAEGASVTPTYNAPTYNAIVTFQYCAPKTVAEMLDIFDGIRFKN